MPNQAVPSQHDALTQAIATIEDLVPTETFCRKFPNIPENTLKWQQTCRHKNGLAEHVKIIGKRRFISIRGYARWLEENQGQEVGA